MSLVLKIQYFSVIFSKIIVLFQNSSYMFIKNNIDQLVLLFSLKSSSMKKYQFLIIFQI